MRCRRVAPIVALTLVLGVGACGGSDVDVSSEAPDTATDAPDTATADFGRDCPEQATGFYSSQFGSEVTTLDTPEAAVVEAMKGISTPPALAAAVESALADAPRDPASTLTGEAVEVVLPEGEGFASVETADRVVARISVIEMAGRYRSDGMEFCSGDFEEPS